MSATPVCNCIEDQEIGNNVMTIKWNERSHSIRVAWDQQTSHAQVGTLHCRFVTSGRGHSWLAGGGTDSPIDPAAQTRNPPQIGEMNLSRQQLSMTKTLLSYLLFSHRSWILFTSTAYRLVTWPTLAPFGHVTHAGTVWSRYPRWHRLVTWPTLARRLELSIFELCGITVVMTL